MVKNLRRTLFACVGAGLVVAVLRLRAADERANRRAGGWRELSGPDLR